MQLEESLTVVQRGDRSIAEYLKVVGLTSDELTMIVVRVIAGILNNFHQSKQSSTLVSWFILLVVLCSAYRPLRFISKIIPLRVRLFISSLIIFSG